MKANKDFHNSVIISNCITHNSNTARIDAFIDNESERITTDDLGNITHIDNRKVCHKPNVYFLEA